MHSPRWSLPDHMPLPWAHDFKNWLNDNSLANINPPGISTWHSGWEGGRPLVLDLAFVNETTVFSHRVSMLTISPADSLSYDHATLILDIYPLDSIALLPPPAPTGFRPVDNHRDAWTKAFTALTTNLTDACPEDPESLPAQWLLGTIKHLDNAIHIASQQTLEPRRPSNPKGADWWNEACSAAAATSRATPAA
jgi:hypothetical protein